MNLTEEQEAVVDAVCNTSIPSDNIIAVEAIAGSGKTRTANACIEAYKPSNGFYTAFNRSVVNDGLEKFGKYIACKTFHALAYQYANPHKLKPTEFTVTDIEENISIHEKYLVIRAIDEFYRSKYTDFDKFFETYYLESDDLKELCVKYADMMLNEEINPTFNCMLKIFHMMLEEGFNLNFDLLIFDEVQDVVSVTYEIFKLLDAKRKLILGDSFQNIYSFMKTINAFELLEDDTNIATTNLHLTKSFRCTPNIAKIVDFYGKLYLDDNFRFYGNEEIEKEIINPNSNAILTRSNATLLKTINDKFLEDKGFTLTRDPYEIFSLPLAIYVASRGKPVKDNKFKYLNAIKGVGKDYFSNIILLDWIEDNVKTTAKTVCELLKQNVNLFDLYNQVKSMKKDPSLVLSTIHTFKGLEADTVTITSDLDHQLDKSKTAFSNIRQKQLSIKEARKQLQPLDKELLNLAYVGYTRARHVLNK